jgi:CDP-paratose 2-epimerase
VALQQTATRYQPVEAAQRQHGIDEQQRLAFPTPNGCSRGAADQYVLDHASSFGLQTVVLRLGSIYGPHQLGTADHGFVTHFVSRALEGQPITLHGDGKQVRDLLFADDLVEAILTIDRVGWTRLTGQAFNVGGGPASAFSLLELLDLFPTVGIPRPTVEREPWRAADPRYYVSDTRRFAELTGWRPRTSVDDGLRRLHGWLLERQPTRLPEAML